MLVATTALFFSSLLSFSLSRNIRSVFSISINHSLFIFFSMITVYIFFFVLSVYVCVYECAERAHLSSSIHEFVKTLMLRLLIIWNILHVHNLLHIPFFPIILFCCFHFSDLIESAFAIIYQHKFSSRSGKSRVMLFKYIPNDSNDCFSCKLLTKFRIFFLKMIWL